MMHDVTFYVSGGVDNLGMKMVNGGERRNVLCVLQYPFKEGSTYPLQSSVHTSRNGGGVGH